MTDSFFLRTCGHAIRKLLDINLRLEVEENQIADLTLKLKIGTYRVMFIHFLEIFLKLNKIFCFKEGQMSQFEVISRALGERIRTRDEDDPSKLNLNSFNAHPFFKEIILNLGNTKCFETICSKLNGNDIVRKRILSITLCNNNIKTLAPLKFLNNFSDLKSLDLRFNDIAFVDELHHLKMLKLNELFLHGNRVTENKNFMMDLKEILPSLKSIDGLSLVAEARPIKSSRETATLSHSKNYARMVRNTITNGNDDLECLRDGKWIRPCDINTHSSRVFESTYKPRSNEWWHELKVIINLSKFLNNAIVYIWYNFFRFYIITQCEKMIFCRRCL